MMNQYTLSRSFWDFAFDNPEKIKPHHVAIYFFAVEQCNRLGWKEKFGFPTTMAMEAIGIKSYGAFKRHLDDLVEWGIVLMVESSKNQYSSNIISLNSALTSKAKALDKALIKHTANQQQSTDQSTGSIDKQSNKRTRKPSNKAKAGEISKAEIKRQMEAEYNLIEKDMNVIAAFITTKKPQFSAPYRDLWNLFAAAHGKAVILDCDGDRGKKLHTRLVDPKFNWVAILKASRSQSFPMTNTWFTFDWLIGNHTNYKKILEYTWKDDTDKKDDQKSKNEFTAPENVA